MGALFLVAMVFSVYFNSLIFKILSAVHSHFVRWTAILSIFALCILDASGKVDEVNV